MPKYLEPVSYEKLTSGSKPFYFWQHKNVDNVLDEKEVNDFEAYKTNLVGIANRLVEKKIKEDLKDKQDDYECYKCNVLMYDYLTYKFSRNGEHIFHIMPKLAESLMEGKDKEVRIEQWVLPYIICYFKIPRGMMHYNWKGKNVDVEGVFVEEVFHSKDTKLANRKGIRLAAVDYDGNFLMTSDFNYSITEKGKVIRSVGGVCGENDINFLNSLYKFLDVILKYIDKINQKKNVVVISDGSNEEAYDGKETKPKKRIGKKKNKKSFEDMTDQEKEMLGIKVIVIEDKENTRVGFKKTGTRTSSGPRICFGVQGYWRTLNSSVFTKMQGHKVWTKGHVRGLNAHFRVGKIYQIGRE